MTVQDDRRQESSGEERVVRLLRRAGDLSAPPPPQVWRAVEEELGNPSGASSTRRARGSRHAAGPRRAHGSRRAGRRSWPGVLPMLAEAEVGGVVALSGDRLLQGGQEQEPEGLLVAAAGLGPVEDDTDATAGADDLTARAEVVAVDGHRSLLVELDRPVEQEGDYLEVWLLRPDVSGMVSVGVLQGTTARLELPDDVSLEEYPVVDISVERLDGDPTHGGRSVLRGELSDDPGLTAHGAPGG